jgi:hypothetical protein
MGLIIVGWIDGFACNWGDGMNGWIEDGWGVIDQMNLDGWLDGFASNWEDGMNGWIEDGWDVIDQMDLDGWMDGWMDTTSKVKANGRGER